MGSVVRVLSAAAAVALSVSAVSAGTAMAAGGSDAATLTAGWGAGCRTISVTSSGQSPDDRILVRWYGADGTNEQSASVPVNTTWSQAVDPAAVRGFSYRVVDASGAFTTPLREEAASCVVVRGPRVSATSTDCDTVHVEAEGTGTYFQGVVRFRDANGAYAAAELTAPGTAGTYQGAFGGDVDLPAGTWTAVVGYHYNGSWLPKSTSSPVEVTGACATPTPTPTSTPTQTAPTTGPTPAPSTPPAAPAPTPTTTAPSAPTTPGPTPPATAPATPTRPVAPAKPTAPAIRTVVRIFQVDRYRRATARTARVVAGLAADRRLTFREDRALWGHSRWEFVTVRVPVGASPARIMRAVDAASRVGDVTTTSNRVPAGRGDVVMAWELGRGASPRAPWGKDGRVAQTYLGRSA